jgi:hypothetical protein
MVRWLRAPRETFAAWSLMLLEGVRSLDEAVEEVREDKRQREHKELRQRDHERLERAKIKALNRQNRPWPRGGRGGRQVELPAASAAGGQAASEPAIGAGTELPSAELPVRARPALQPVREEAQPTTAAAPFTIDLTAEDDTMTLPRLDSLERKLEEMERQFG